MSGAFNGRSLSADIVDSSEAAAGKAVVTATDVEIRQRVSELDSEVSGDSSVSEMCWVHQCTHCLATI